MSFLAELWAFLRARRRLWLAPIIIVTLLLGLLLTRLSVPGESEAHVPDLRWG